MFWIKLISHEIRHAPRFTLLFLINLTIGLSGFAMLDSVKRAFDSSLSAASQQLLGADIEIASRRELTDQEVKTLAQLMPKTATQLRMDTLYSMLRFQERSQLVEIKAISQGHPLYGSITLEHQGLIPTKTAGDIFKGPYLWAAPDLLLMLGAKRGDKLELGSQNLQVTDTITSDTGMRWTGAALAPRIYISQAQLAASQLIQPGSIVWRSHLFKLSQSTDIDALHQKLLSSLSDPGIKIQVHHKSADNSGRLLKYLADYLGLAAMIALALACLGAMYLFSHHLHKNRLAIATLQSLGLTIHKCIGLYLAIIIILGCASAVLASLTAFALLPFSEALIKLFAPMNLTPTLHPITVVVTFALGMGGALFTCLPTIQTMRSYRPIELLMAQETQPRHTLLLSFILILPTVIGFYGLAIWQSQSLRTATAFCSALVIAAGVLGLSAQAFIQLITKWQPQALSWRLALQYLEAKRREASLAILAIGLGTMLLQLVPMVKSSLEQELMSPGETKLPSLFLFDIQEDQKQALTAKVESLIQESPSLSPMIRARLLEINGQAFKREDREESLRERQEQQRMRNRGLNLSYRPGLNSSETLAAGRLYRPQYDPDNQELPEVTLEVRYAKRLGIKEHDKLTFEIQGIPIKAKVVGFRKVKWTSFQPNFFIMFQPGVLEDAPKTYIAALPELDSKAKMQVQTQLAESFANISAIDVSKVVTKILDIVGKMAVVLVVMAVFVALAGFCVVISIAQYQAQLRGHDRNLLKILGMSFTVIQRTTMYEFALIALPAALLGTLLSGLATSVLTYVVFEAPAQIQWGQALVIMLGTAGVSMGSAFLLTVRQLRQKPQLYLD